MTRLRYRGRRLFRGLASAAVGVIVFAIVATAQEHSSPEHLKQLIDQIARGDEVESAAASERLVELVTQPVIEALGTLESRPIEEQLRLQRTLARLTGALRLRAFRLDLSSEDRTLFDAFVRAYPELAERLFDGDWRIRKAAVRQLPLEPGTGVGLLIAAKVNDEDADVAETALDMALALHDEIVARSLTRYVRDAARAMQAGLYQPHQWELALSLAMIVQRSIEVIAAADYRAGVPAIIEAAQHFRGTRLWDQANRAAVLRALGRLKDPQAAAFLLESLDDRSFLRWRGPENDKRVVETVGDTALAALLHIYRRPAEEFGLFTTEEDKTFSGYATEDERSAGHRAFRIWYEQNAQPQRENASQPTPTDGEPRP